MVFVLLLFTRWLCRTPGGETIPIFGCVFGLNPFFFCRVVCSNPGEVRAWRRAIGPQLQPFPVPGCTQGRGPSTSPCSAPRSCGIGGSPSCSTKDRSRCVHPAMRHGLGEENLPLWAQHSNQSFQNSFLSTFILASGGTKDPDAHSSVMSWVKMARVSAPP